MLDTTADINGSRSVGPGRGRGVRFRALGAAAGVVLDQMRRETVFEKRYAIWKQAHTFFYEAVPVIRHPDIFGLHVMAPSVKGTAHMMRPFFWNVWLEK